MKMKIKNCFKRIFAFLFICILMLNILVMPAFASPFSEVENGGYDRYYFTNLKNEMNNATMLGIWDYVDLLYSLNMTNGYRLMAMSCRVTTDSSSASGSKFELTLYMVSGVNIDEYYMGGVDATFNPNVNSTSSLQLYHGDSIVSTSSDNAGGQWRSCTTSLQTLGCMSTSAGTSRSFSVSTTNYAYRNRYNEIVWGKANASVNSFIKEGEEAPIISAWRNSILSFMESWKGDEPPTIIYNVYSPSFELDIGGLITSIMTAPRQIFDGVFGFNIFGINIASTLIAILAVAVVIFIIKVLKP